MLRRQGGETIRFKYGLCFFRASVFFQRTVRYLQHLPCGHGYLVTGYYLVNIHYSVSKVLGRHHGGLPESRRLSVVRPFKYPPPRHRTPVTSSHSSHLQSPPATLHPLTTWRTRHQWPPCPPPDSLGRLCVNAKLGAPGRRDGRETRAEVPRVM